MTKEKYERRFDKKYENCIKQYGRISVLTNLETLGIRHKENLQNLKKRYKRAEVSCKRFEEKFKR